jgi:hypothetical protein
MTVPSSPRIACPMLEQPADLASDLIGFGGSLGRAPHQQA